MNKAWNEKWGGYLTLYKKINNKNMYGDVVTKLNLNLIGWYFQHPKIVGTLWRKLRWKISFRKRLLLIIC